MDVFFLGSTCESYLDSDSRLTFGSWCQFGGSRTPWWGNRRWWCYCMVFLIRGAQSTSWSRRSWSVWVEARSLLEPHGSCSLCFWSDGTAAACQVQTWGLVFRLGGWGSADRLGCGLLLAAVTGATVDAATSSPVAWWLEPDLCSVYLILVQGLRDSRCYWWSVSTALRRCGRSSRAHVSHSIESLSLRPSRPSWSWWLCWRTWSTQLWRRGLSYQLHPIWWLGYFVGSWWLSESWGWPRARSMSRSTCLFQILDITCWHLTSWRRWLLQTTQSLWLA